MTITKKYFDTKENLLKLKEALPHVIKSLNSGGFTPGVNRMFEEDSDDGGSFLDRYKPCCTVGHLIYTAGLSDEVHMEDNNQMPGHMFDNLALASAVNSVSVANDSNLRPDDMWKADITRELEWLKVAIDEALEAQ